MISMNAEALILFLVAFLVTIYLVAVFYLSRRSMSKLAYVFWGIFALLLPAFGPFFVIAYRPGEMAHRKRGRQKSALRHRQNIRI